MSTGSLLREVVEQKLEMDLESHEFETDNEVFALTALQRQDQAGEKAARFASRRTLASFGLSTVLLLGIVSFAASSRGHLWSGLRNSPHSAATKVVTSILNEVGELAKEEPLTASSDARLLKAVFEETSANTFFQELQMDDGTVSYRHRSGLLITAKAGQQAMSSPSVSGSTQFFGKTTNEDGTTALMVHGGNWLTALPSGIIVANGTSITAWQSFTLQRGENGTVALRSIHGKYVGLNQTAGDEFAVDRSMLMRDEGFGRRGMGAGAFSIITAAEADNIGSREKFTIVNNEADETVNLKTRYDTFLTSPSNLSGLVSGDSTMACGREAFALVHRHGKVYLHTFDGRYITAQRHGFLAADSTRPGIQEAFDMEFNDDGTVALKSFHGRYITATKVSLLPDGGDWAFAV